MGGRGNFRPQLCAATIWMGFVTPAVTAGGSSPGGSVSAETAGASENSGVARS